MKQTRKIAKSGCLSRRLAALEEAAGMNREPKPWGDLDLESLSAKERDQLIEDIKAELKRREQSRSLSEADHARA